jgi:hypothetical protein
MKRNRTLMGSLTILLSLATSLATADSYQGRFERTLQVSGPADLEVLTHSGDVIVRSGEAGNIRILGKIHVENRWWGGDKKDDVSAIEKNPPIQQSGNSVRVDYLNYRNISVDYEITVPPDTRLRSKSGSGNLIVEGLHANLELETGSGDVRLRDLTGEVHAHTGSGNIRADNVSGAFDAHAGSGDIRLEEKGQGDVRADTGSGNIEVRDVNGGLHASAGSGNVKVEGKPAYDWNVKTGSGNVEVKVPEQAAFDVDISTSSGTVTVDHPISTTIQGRVQSPQREIRGQVHGGGPEVRVHTGSGDIHVY